jgi:rubrerythrin
MQQILEGILEAIEDEIKAQKRFRQLADRAEDPKVKKFFEQLRLDEEDHERVLRARYEAFTKVLKTETAGKDK